MNYCSQCGSDQLAFEVPAGDNRPRFCCRDCHTIHYQNPKLVVGTLPIWEDKILLCKRAIEPRAGYWTLPAGFYENNEALGEGALRETWEEAGADIELDDIYTIFSIPHINQVHVFFRARLKSPHFAPGEESLEAKLFSINEIPWQELSFPVVRRTLECYLDDRVSGQFPLHNETIAPRQSRLTPD